ncbi:MAG: leucine-rich repeat domain-containing protein, partial [Holosporales bacterium]|nr:leucine-rich repeat domain-containing protein [Holosporales bacterium]
MLTDYRDSGSVVFEAGSRLERIGGYAFYHCSSLSSIAIPKGVTIIEEDAFMSDKNLVSITFGTDSQLTAIGKNAFSGCSSLGSIVIPKGVTTIGENTFRAC